MADNGMAGFGNPRMEADIELADARTRLDRNLNVTRRLRDVIGMKALFKRPRGFSRPDHRKNTFKPEML